MTRSRRTSSLHLGRRALLALIVAGAPACGGRSPLDVDDGAVGPPPNGADDVHVDGELVVITAEERPRLVAVDVVTGEGTLVSPPGHAALFAAWSPRGEHLLVASSADGQTLELALHAPMDGGWAPPVPVLTTSIDDPPGRIEWAPSADRIALTFAMPDRRLSVASIDPGGEVALADVAVGASPDWWVEFGGWSGDGGAVVWEATSPVEGTVFGVTRLGAAVDGSQADTTVLAIPEGYVQPWLAAETLPVEGWANPLSADGRWVSIHARTADDGRRALLIADATGATPTWVVAESQGEGDLGPTQAWWAPDGRSLAFVHRGSVGDPFDEDLHVVVPGATQSGAAPSLWPWRWLADGSIVGMRAEGEVVRVALTTSLGLEEQIRARGMIDIGIGDDGQVLAEAERTDGAFAVSWVSSAGVHDPTEVLVSTERFEVERAQWSPGGDLVAVVNPGDERVHVIDVGDGGPRVVLDAPAARWSNSNDVLESPWSPDGRALVVRRNDGIRVHRRGGSGFASELTIANTDRVSWYGWQPAR